ncbi:MAG: tetratricopeptide repeat protein [Mangrovibacterium sp.]
MKSIFTKTNVLTLLMFLACPIIAMAQKEISGVVYEAGTPKAGMEVSAHKGTSSYSDHEGKFTITLDEKCKYIKFTDLVTGKSSKLDVDGTEESPLRFSVDGSALPELGAGGFVVDNRSQAELVAAQETKYMEELTLYEQDYKQHNYTTALKHWKTVYNRYPKSSLNVYIQGVNIYKNIMSKSTSMEAIDAYVDTLSQIYAKRIENFGNEGFVRGREATDFFNSYANQTLTDAERVDFLKRSYDKLGKAIELNGEQTEPAVLVIYMGVTKSLFRSGNLAKEKVVANYGKISAIVDNNLAIDADNEQMTATKEEVDKAFQTSGAADCEALLAYYEPKFETLKTEEEGLKKMLRALDRQNCTDTQVYADAAEAMYEMNPSAEAAFNMARLFVKRDQIDQAKVYYKKAINDETDKELLGKYYYELALFTFAKEHAFTQAKSFVKESIANDPKSGRSYILLGDIYAQGAKTYSDDAFKRATVYWVAVDYYNKAKQVEPDVAQEANQKIATYSAYYPDKETMFFQGLQVGQSYKLDGWINETTKVRVR